MRCELLERFSTAVLVRRLQGQHPKHKGESDPTQLGTVERYFIEIMDIPRLQQRIDCFVFTRTYGATAERVPPQLTRVCCVGLEAARHVLILSWQDCLWNSSKDAVSTHRQHE